MRHIFVIGQCSLHWGAELCQVQNYICDPHNPLNLISVSNKCWQNREELSLKLQSLIPRIGDMARESFLLLKSL
ncbi:hypothetical protein [Prevotella bivia]|uniref:hypothetical protein n=1 Tax=Prevotella bivia TaxID=28125 RepID=UPI0009B837BF|nr:hypothetical protein [Prevotella bivia]